MRKLVASAYFFFRYHFWVLSFGLAVLLTGVFLSLVGPSLWAWQAQEVREALALLSLVALPPLLSGLTGARSWTTARALQNQRFLLSQGLSPAHMWWGALSASLFLAVLAAFLGAIPAFRLPLRELPRNLWDYVFFAVAVLASWALGHLLTIMLRARTRWLVGDLVGAILASWGWYALWQRLQNSLEFGALLPVLVLTLGCATVFSLLISFFTLTRARTHLPAAHRQATLTLWPSLVALALGFLGILAFLERMAPYHLRWVYTTVPDPTARFWFSSGQAFGPLKLRSTFLWDRETNVRKRIEVKQRFGLFFLLPSGLSFSPEGQKLAFVDEDERSHLVLVELATGTQRQVATLTPGAKVCALGPAGRMVAVEEPDNQLVLLNAQTLEKKSVFAESGSRAAFWVCQAFADSLEAFRGEWQNTEKEGTERSLHITLWQLPWDGSSHQEVWRLQFSGPYNFAFGQRLRDRFLLRFHRTDPWDPNARSTLVLTRQGQTLWQQDLPAGASAFLVPRGVALTQPTTQGMMASLVDDSGKTTATATLPLTENFRCEVWPHSERQFVVACQGPLQKTVFFRWDLAHNHTKLLAKANSHVTGYQRSWWRRWFFLKEPYPAVDGQPTFRAEGALFSLDPSSGHIRQLLP